MSGFFYNLGKKIGPHARKGKWLWQSLTGSEADMIKTEYVVGQDLACEIRQQAGLVRHTKIEQLLHQISIRLIERVAHKQRKFKFEMIKSPDPNAFALPGGFIFLTESLIELCQWQPDEIAFILGHEMAHVIRGHALKRIVSSSAMTAVSRAAPARNLLTVWLRQVGIQFFANAYSQDRELQADQLGARLAQTAGYHPDAPAQLLSRLAQLNHSTPDIDPHSYFSSHPPLAFASKTLKTSCPENTSSNAGKR